MINEYLRRLEILRHKFEIFSIGQTFLGQDIEVIKVPSAFAKGNIIVQGGIHAREWITSFLCLKLAEEYAIQRLKYNIYVIPCANLDGFALSTLGIKIIKNKQLYNFLLKINGGENFSLWKANARGVDLNVNFDAEWGKGKQNIKIPFRENYIGECPNSEMETGALINFTRQIQPIYTISYHSKGEEIYANFGENYGKNGLEIAKIIEKETKYQLKFIKNSVGGYKDFCIQEFNIPSVTIEVGNDSFKHPIGLGELDKIFTQNNQIILKIQDCI